MYFLLTLGMIPCHVAPTPSAEATESVGEVSCGGPVDAAEGAAEEDLREESGAAKAALLRFPSRESEKHELMLRKRIKKNELLLKDNKTASVLSLFYLVIFPPPRTA